MYNGYKLSVGTTGRLSKDEIERMVSDAEKFKAEDEGQRERITAKNGLESYAYNMKSTMEDDKLKDKISPEDKQTVLDKCKEAVDWLDHNQVCPNSLLSSLTTELLTFEKKN